MRQDIIKLIEENIGKTFSDINCTNVFLGQSPKAVEIKAKINRWDLKTYKLLHSKKNPPKKQKESKKNPYKQNKKTTYRLEGNICK